MTENELKNLASQLSCPTGEAGRVTGERMSVSNANMIQRTVDTLTIRPDENILEIGPGNGSHVAAIVSATGARYTGTDLSETMVQEARQRNATAVAAGNVVFTLADGTSLAFASGSFDAVFTVNTIYFWQNPLGFAQEIYRILRPGGRFGLAFAHADFMATLPFTTYGFTLYTPAKATELLNEARFLIQDVVQETELVAMNNAGETVERVIVILLATRS